MSRVGKKPVAIPDKVKVKIEDGFLLAEGPLGKEKVAVHPRTTVVVKDGQVQITPIGAPFESRRFHGLMRALVANAINGVSTGFNRELDINGVGFRAELKGKVLNLTLGYSHPIDYEIPEGIKVAVDKQTHLVVSGSSREMVGRVAAKIRGFRPPEPYKGKGIKYTQETIIRKVGKAAAGATGGGK